MDANTFPAGLRVLAVDDDRVCLKVLERQLKYCNYNATMVMDAKTALDMLRERKDGNQQFDLVISNVSMPNMDGFQLLQLIGLEMDLPVIMLSADSETRTIMKGIKHGACDYIVKSVRLEQLRGIWTHVVKNSKTNPRNNISNGSDAASQKLSSGDSDRGVKVGTNHMKKYSKKNNMVVDVADAENISTLKKQRVQWSGELHRKFVEAVRQIGIDRAIPKKILEVMNVEGLTRENIASHLQKYRIFLKRLSEGTLRNSNPFANETEAFQRNMNVPSLIGSPSSSSHFANLNSSNAIGMQRMLPTQLVPMPMQHISRLISSGNSYAPVSSGGLAGASQCFPSGSSGISLENISNGVVLNTSKTSTVDISGSSYANIPIVSPPLTSSMPISSSRSCTSYARILRGKILGSSRGIPFEDITDDEMVGPSGHLPLQSSELVNQPSVQLQSCSTGLFNKVAREVHQFSGPSNLSMVGFREQVAPLRFGNSTHSTVTPVDNSSLASSSSTRTDLMHIDNSAMLVLNGGGATDNVHEGSTVNQQVVSDQVDNINNEFLMGTSEAHNEESDYLDDLLADLVNQDFLNNGDSFIDWDWDFFPLMSSVAVADQFMVLACCMCNLHYLYFVVD